jgi:hypothetical protein
MARRVTCSLEPEDFQMPLLVVAGAHGPTLLGSIPSAELGLGTDSQYESPWEKCPVCNRAKRKDNECLQCFSGG